MALPSSGALSINDIAVEFGGSVPHSLSEYYGAAAGIPTSGAISIDDFYGASAAVLDLRGTTQNVSNRNNIYASMGASIPVNLTGQSIQTGDLVFICIASRALINSIFTWSGMTLNNGFGTGTSYSSPGRAIAYGTWASGNSNPYISVAPNKGGSDITQQTAIFFDAGGIIQSSISDQQSSSSSSTIPASDLSSYSGGATPAGVITILLADTESAIGTSAVGITAPSGYTMAASDVYITQGSKAARGSFLAIAYKVSTSTSSETVGNWTVGSDLSSGTNFYSTATFRVGA